MSTIVVESYTEEQQQNSIPPSQQFGNVPAKQEKNRLEISIFFLFFSKELHAAKQWENSESKKKPKAEEE